MILNSRFFPQKNSINLAFCISSNSDPSREKEKIKDDFNKKKKNSSARA